MNIVDIKSELAARRLEHPALSALAPNEELYSVALYQPCGPIVADNQGVHVSDDGLVERAGQFVDKICEMKTELAVCPEYSMPRRVLLAKLSNGVTPVGGKLWVFGCEAVPVSEFAQFVTELEEHCLVIHEPIDGFNPGKFINPVAYVFTTSEVDSGPPQLVVVIQFKTNPMADPKNFEVGNMEKGSAVYRFGTDHQVRLLTLICSDALGVKDEFLEEIYENTLLLHLQLNPGYRDPKFSDYRERLFFPDCDRTELICLNWSSPVEINGEPTTPLGGTAWYLRPSQFDSSDDAINENHRGGLYYTWFGNSRAHAMFVNRAPGIYIVDASKVRHHGIAGNYRRSGPAAREFLGWDSEKSTWTAQHPDSGFAESANDLGQAEAELLDAAESNPTAVERVVNLSIGNVRDGEWFKLSKLPSCLLKPDEHINRFTYCQEDDDGARERRTSAFMRVGALRKIIEQEDDLPEALKDLAESGKFEWSSSSPHQNLRGDSGLATVVYLSEDASASQIAGLAGRVQEYLYRTADNSGASKRARQRLAIFFRRDGNLRAWTPDVNRIDDAGELSPVDLAKDQ